MAALNQFVFAERGSLPSNPVAETSAKSILAVDDEPSACKLLSLFLATPTLRCSTATSGEEALERLRHERFDAIISDLQMPGIGGLGLLSAVRRSYPYMAFLVTTGVDDVEVGVRAMRSGADDYLVKPLHESAVLASLENALYRRQLEKENHAYRRSLEEMVAGRTIQLRNALRELELGYENTLQALGAAIDLRDNATAGHSRRVCRYSLKIAAVMGWSEQDCGSLARGAYLHDIGKLGTPDGILLKPGPLTEDERKIMQQHAQIGFDLIKSIPFLADAAEIVLAHHERCDGSGYPRGLKGNEIPEGARIFAVADALDAITSDRPYRSASPFEVAQDIIRCQSGRQFDAEVVQAFLEIPIDRLKGAAGDHRDMQTLSLGLTHESIG
ncbi:MAG: HD domain-containing phosphohydrolase [Candidatus Acidiferrum sp.]